MGCSVCVACHVVRFVFGCSPGPFPGVAQPYCDCRCLTLGSHPGLGLSLCAPARVLCASVSSRVHLSVRVCTWVCLPIIPGLMPPAVFVSRACTNGGTPSFSSWVWTSAGLLSVSGGRTVVPHTHWCVLCGYFPSGFFPTRWFLVIVAFLSVRGCLLSPCGSPGLLSSVSAFGGRLVLLLSPCVSHPLLSDLHIARCLSQEVATQVALCPAGVLPRRVTLICRGLSLHGFIL
jgi:hypothetical protein